MIEIVTVETLKSKIEEIERNNSNQKVCIVGVVGRFHLFQEASTLNQLLNNDVFKSEMYSLNEQQPELETSIKQVEIRMFYDEEQKTVFLQLNSVYDFAHLVKACRGVHQNLSMAGRHHYWQDQMLKHAAALLFMFSVAHIVVVTFPTPRFDLSYLRLFKMLASARYSMLHSLSQSLASLESIPEIWRTTGRPCIPRIIFSFQVPWSSAKHMSENSIRKLQQSLQDQVHLILKKNRLLGSLSSSSLFTVSSPNQLFVHVESPKRVHVNPVSFCINYVLKNSVNLDAMCPPVTSKKSEASIVSQQSPVKTSPSPTEDAIIKDVTLREFLYKQIDYMMTVESRDVPAEGRRGTHVEAPDICLWIRVCCKVFDYFLGNTSDNNSHLKALAQSLDLDWKFSENRCHKVSPIATNAYLDNLPSHYTQSFHLGQLSHCLRVFTMNARGPAFEHYAQQLQEECNQVWWNGRHLCEITSMTGQPCVYPYHGLPDGKHDLGEDQSGVSAIKSHSSRVTTLSACNCGRTQGTREDPFDLKCANCDFYQELEKKCCSYLLHMTFPSYPDDDPVVKTKAVAPTLQKRLETHQITILGRQSKSDLSSDTSLSAPMNTITMEKPNSKGSQAKQSQSQTEKDLNAPQQITQENENVVTPAGDFDHSNASPSRLRTISTSNFQANASLSLPGTQPIASEGEGASYYSEYEGMVQGTKNMSLQQGENGEPNNNDSNVSHSEYYDGMFTTNLPPHILPMFSSWSLIMLGSANLYNPAKGVEQVGYFTGSNYLLLWDIPIDVTAANELTEQTPAPIVASQEELWPAPGEILKPKPPPVPAPSTVSGSSTHLPLFQTMNKIQNQSNEILSSNKPAVGKAKRPNSKESTSVKAYIGHEYECPRGHRFFCSAPDKMVKASSSGHVRENATKLVTGHMPVYFPCPCRSTKPLHLAQLTRTYAVTPDCHVTISINPRVQPGDNEVTPIFYTGIKDGIILPPNSYCVLRYPYVYIDENGPILPPAPSQPLLTCRLLKGMFSFSNVLSNDDVL